jgi:outer membrane protein TolC
VEQRREIEIARRAAAGAVYGLEAARADFRPRIYVRSVIARVDGQGVDEEFVEGAGIHFDQQFYAGGQREGARRAAEADVRSAAANAQLVCDNIALDVNLAYREIAVARQRIELAETSVVQARENLRLVTVKYRNGDATPTDIVDAETALTRSQQRFYTATYDYLTALARLDYAMGRPQGCLLQPAAGIAPDNPTPGDLPVPRPLPKVD